MSTESLWNQNLLARYAHLPMAEERQQFLQHKLDEGSSWSSLRQLGIYIAAAVSRMQLTSESRLTPKAIDIATKAWANREPHASRLTDPQQVQRRFRVIATDWFRFLGRLDEPPILEGPHHGVLQNFARFLRDERGLAEPTIKKQCDAAKEFPHSQPRQPHRPHPAGVASRSFRAVLAQGLEGRRSPPATSQVPLRLDTGQPLSLASRCAVRPRRPDPQHRSRSLHHAMPQAPHKPIGTRPTRSLSTSMVTR